MDQLPSPIGPSAKIPLLEGCRLRFAQGFENDASAWALTSLFPKVATELDALPNLIKLDKTIDLFNRAAGFLAKGDISDMFHAIPRSMLESVILGTVAFDRHRTHGRLRGLAEDGPGIYVVGLSIVSRGGRFVDASELNALIKNLEKYIVGADLLLDDWDPTAATASERAAVALVTTVDVRFGRPPPGATKARFITNRDNVQAAGYLVASLRRRLVTMEATNPKEFTIQSPQYVGCSEKISQRLASYEVGVSPSSLRGVNKMLGLTLCLLGHQGLSPKINPVAALRVWQAGQLPKAEMMMAALAGAYVTQDGFNLEEGGGNKDTLDGDG